MIKKVGYILFFFTTFLYSQDYWEYEASALTRRSAMIIPPSESKLTKLSLDLTAFQTAMHNSRLQAKGNQSFIEIYFPNEKNELEAFLVSQIQVMAPHIAAAYPTIQTYRGLSKERPGVFLRFTYSAQGINGMIRHPEGFYFLQPERGSKTAYVFYKREKGLYADYLKKKCTSQLGTVLHNAQVTNKSQVNQAIPFRSYRIAVTGSGEYTQVWGDDEPSNGSNAEDAFAAVVSTINRINEVFEVDLSLRLLLVSSAENLFEDPSQDPYTGSGSVNTLLDQVQTYFTETLGESNYDLGHLFHAAAPNGSAGNVGNVCIDGIKGGAFSAHSFTATNGSEGNYLTDYFDIDYVAHELGHQFGANHTFAYEANSSRVNSEPGSGSTIMSYAGIVSGENMQRHSDPYFHYHNINEIHSYLDRHGCQELIEDSNQAPVVSAGSNRVIPQGTAYELNAIASDPDQDLLSYCWEQLDSDRVNSNDFGPTQLTGSINRSLPPTSSSVRLIPRLSSILSGRLTEVNPRIDSNWETVSTVGRTMRWGVTVRDRSETFPTGLGQTAQDEITLTVDGDSGPFQVTTPGSSGTHWKTGANELVTWDVAKTNQAPVNTQNVSIFLSEDGGENFPYLLAENIPNNGKAYIVVPEGVESTRARIKIVPQGNIYFAINPVDFQITSRAFGVTLTEVEKTVCGVAPAELGFIFNQYGSNNEAVALSIEGLPAGIEANISDEEVTTHGYQGTLSFINPGASTDVITLTMIARAGEQTERQDFYVQFFALPVIAPTPLYPENNAVDVDSSLPFSWNNLADGQAFQFQLSDEVGFSNLLYDLQVSNNQLEMPVLEASTTYYWRVKSVNSCGESEFSVVHQFSSSEYGCYTYSNKTLPKVIQDASTTDVGVTLIPIAVADNLLISDINVNIQLVHDYLSDLRISLISPEGIRVVLADELGQDQSDYYNTIFDQEADQLISQGNPPFTGSYRPLESLRDLYGILSQGIWQLEIIDNAAIDQGTLQIAELVLCLNGQRKLNSDEDIFIDEEDNCPLITNEDQLDSDQDGEGDICDIDSQRNFSFTKSDETCSNKNNGEVTVSAIARFNYTVLATGPNGFSERLAFSNNLLRISNLSSGDYLFCIRAEELPEFEQCFAATISEPAPLNVSAKVDYTSRKLTLTLEGSDRYYLRLNGNDLGETSSNAPNIKLERGLNRVEVRTPLECQGTYVEYIYLNTPSMLYPNPAKDNLTVLIGGEESEASILLFDLQGNFLFKRSFSSLGNTRQISLDVSVLSSGSYLLKIITTEMEETLKFVKK